MSLIWGGIPREETKPKSLAFAIFAFAWSVIVLSIVGVLVLQILH